MENRRSLFRGFKNFGSLMRDVVHEHKELKKELNKNPNAPAEFFRPPGALPEAEFLNKCTQCNDCMEACTPGAIYKHFDPNSKANLTPIIAQDVIPCELCEDTPCVTACQEGALVLEEDEKPVIGKVQIYIDNCYSWNGIDPECSACAEACPLPEKAIVADSQGRMRVKTALCNGCALCTHVCPEFHNAIKVVALTEERTAPQ